MDMELKYTTHHALFNSHDSNQLFICEVTATEKTNVVAIQIGP